MMGLRARDLERELADAMRLVGALVLRLGGRVELSSDELAEMANPQWHFVQSRDPTRDTVELRCVRQELLATVSVTVRGQQPISLGCGDASDLVALLRQVADDLAGKESKGDSTAEESSSGS